MPGLMGPTHVLTSRRPWQGYMVAHPCCCISTSVLDGVFPESPAQISGGRAEAGGGGQERSSRSGATAPLLGCAGGPGKPACFCQLQLDDYPQCLPTPYRPPPSTLLSSVFSGSSRTGMELVLQGNLSCPCRMWEDGLSDEEGQGAAA